ncbi:secreted RxLR effector protein 161-like [Arachis duranensis]|uniref:Secreted RxLR effector protein 161-like n=1 Tax=Arachis duranensis TaxID=130453 RepID=A0A9C6WSK9_ARADU|nr:secreted RxLR effector protein 161-like [Arachis duranensis]
MGLAKPINIPMHASTKLDKDKNENNVDKTRYQRMIGSQIYLTALRPDIIFIVRLCSRFQSQPKESHLSAVKRIIRYIFGTTNYGLWYPKSDSINLIGYSDANFAGDRIDRRSTSAICCTIGNVLNVWTNKKQGKVAMFTVEAKYIVVSLFCCQLFYYKLNVSNILLMCDNMSVINISKNLVLLSRIEHIEVKYHSIRELVHNRNIDIQFVKFKDQLADILTKLLVEERFLQA